MIPGEADRQVVSGFGRQITRFVRGSMAIAVYRDTSHHTRLKLVRAVARAYEAIWGLPLNQRLIGELRASQVASNTSTKHNADSIILHVGLDRHYSLGGPFSSVRDYLRAFTRSNLKLLEKQEGIDVYKDRYLSRIRSFVDSGMRNIPDIVETIPIVAQHCDLGPHNTIIKGTDVNSPEASQIAAVIDWEFVASQPFVTAIGSIDLLFREFAQNGFGPEYPHADELRAAFWDAIPKWKEWYEHESTVVFLEWYRFALFMKPAAPIEEEGGDPWDKLWAENVRIIEEMLANYGPE